MYVLMVFVGPNLEKVLDHLQRHSQGLQQQNIILYRGGGGGARIIKKCFLRTFKVFIQRGGGRILINVFSELLRILKFHLKDDSIDLKRNKG